MLTFFSIFRMRLPWPNTLLLDSRFAEAHGISVGDSISTEEGGRQVQWLVKGIVRSAEYAYYAPEGLIVPDYNKYGLAYTDASSLPDTTFNEIVLTLSEETDASQEAIIQEIRILLDNSNILSRQHQVSYRKMVDCLTGIK